MVNVFWDTSAMRCVVEATSEVFVARPELILEKNCRIRCLESEKQCAIGRGGESLQKGVY